MALNRFPPVAELVSEGHHHQSQQLRADEGGDLELLQTSLKSFYSSSSCSLACIAGSLQASSCGFRKMFKAATAAEHFPEAGHGVKQKQFHGAA